MILRAKWVLDRALDWHENGTVDTGGSSSQILDLGDSILMPGLFNAHAHLDYTHLRGSVPAHGSFVDWVGRINKQKQGWADTQFKASIAAGLKESVNFGTTSMVNWLCHPATLPQKPAPLRMWWLWEQIAFHPKQPLPEWKNWPNCVSPISPLWKGGLAPHAPYTCRADLIHKVAEWSAQYQLPWSIHVAESRDEEEMFCHASGPFFNLFHSLGRDLSDCGHGSPLHTLKSVISNLKSPLLLVHANLLLESDVQLLTAATASARAPLSIVHCPRSHQFFNHPPFPLEVLRKTGVNLCLGTDSLASNADLSMFLEMSTLAKSQPKLAPKEIVSMATRNGAHAVGMEKEWLGWHDWVTLPAPNSPSDLWPSIVNFTGCPRFAMVDGKVLTFSP